MACTDSWARCHKIPFWTQIEHYSHGLLRVTSDRRDNIFKALIKRNDETLSEYDVDCARTNVEKSFSFDDALFRSADDDSTVCGITQSFSS